MTNTEILAQADLAECVRDAFYASCLTTISTALGDLADGQTAALSEIEQIELFEFGADWATEMWRQLEGVADALAARNFGLCHSQGTHA